MSKRESGRDRERARGEQYRERATGWEMESEREGEREDPLETMGSPTEDIGEPIGKQSRTQ